MTATAYRVIGIDPGLAATGYGGAPKEQVQAMVTMQLGLDAPPEPLDAADALALALTRLAEAALESRMVGRP